MVLTSLHGYAFLGRFRLTLEESQRPPPCLHRPPTVSPHRHRTVSPPSVEPADAPHTVALHHLRFGSQCDCSAMASGSSRSLYRNSPSGVLSSPRVLLPHSPRPYHRRSHRQFCL